MLGLGWFPSGVTVELDFFFFYGVCIFAFGAGYLCAAIWRAR